ncbi:MAG: PilZ domain-containing protein [Candidatus Omnitrophica bacterium]|nr:PilZ domain-containing protein [Candidatus Omnitrophota bacterium]
MEQQKPFKERRKYVRLKATAEVKYTVIGKPGEIKVFSKDISAGGLCIVHEEELPANTPLQLEIKIPDLKDPIFALARVVWQQRMEAASGEPKVYYNTGVEFTGISDFDRFNINRYVIEQVEPED